MVLSQREEEEEESPRVSFASGLILSKLNYLYFFVACNRHIIARRNVVSHLQQIFAVDEISVSITKRVDIGPLCEFDITVHEVAVGCAGQGASNGGSRHDKKDHEVALAAEHINQCRRSERREVASTFVCFGQFEVLRLAKNKLFANINNQSKEKVSTQTHTARSFMLWVISGGACPLCMVAICNRLPDNN